jgi:hypothetical protein
VNQIKLIKIDSYKNKQRAGTGLAGPSLIKIEDGEIQMKAYVEKRVSRRCSYEAAVTCAYFNSDRFYRAKTTNHSREGIYFESDFPLKPGSAIYIRVENYTTEPSVPKCCSCGGVPYVTLAEVKWCQELPSPDNYHYRIGLKYYEPAI